MKCFYKKFLIWVNHSYLASLKQTCIPSMPWNFLDGHLKSSLTILIDICSLITNDLILKKIIVLSDSLMGWIHVPTKRNIFQITQEDFVLQGFCILDVSHMSVVAKCSWGFYFLLKVSRWESLKLSTTRVSQIILSQNFKVI